ncbi:hypothetical protein BGW38_007698 [Lunasporangiospora selenospora]|uniref:Protein transport protein yif1 n=1 Tax=Lunasporangiospora selenospora TaxID=979761 RepID=A0A9P6FZ27_9FUNG|nr:hypothetical protein BGW38_007698 [Lunasporangiospora selenospora]
MNPYENSGGFTQPQPRHNAQQQQQQQQPQQQSGYYTPQKYTPNAYQPQQQVPGQQQQQQQHFQGGPRNHMTSPPPLQHPVPTHPPVQMRDPTGTPSPRMNFAQAQGGQYNQNQYRGGVQQQQPPSQQQQQQQQHLQQRSSFEQTSLSVNAFGNSPRQQFMSPQHHHQQQSPLQQHPQQQQQQQQTGIPSFPFNLNDGTTQLGMQFGKSAVMAGQEYVEQNLNRWVNRAALQPYFNVSNSYVINKLKLLVFPWRHKTWARVLKRSETTAETVGYLPPRDDINAPDMYIPVMAFVTYILLTGIQKGTTVGFKPENLGSTASSALAVVLLEFSMIKLFIYLLNISSEVSMLDLLAYSSYKFVSIIVSMIALLAGAPPVFFWGIFLYTGIATGFFLLRSLRYVILPESAAGTVQAPQRKRRINFLICLSVLQFGFMWMLV